MVSLSMFLALRRSEVLWRCRNVISLSRSGLCWRNKQQPLFIIHWLLSSWEYYLWLKIYSCCSASRCCLFCMQQAGGESAERVGHTCRERMDTHSRLCNTDYSQCVILFVIYSHTQTAASCITSQANKRSTEGLTNQRHTQIHCSFLV